MVRFLQTGDWQLGMTRHFFSEGVQERFSQARFDAIRNLGRIAKDEKCDFMVVCGDVFESNFVDRKTVARALEALHDVAVPVFLLPGNHDPLDASSIYKSKGFRAQKPDHVTVLDLTEPVSFSKDVEIVGIPWFAKKADHDLVAEALAELEPLEKGTRIAVGHGILDVLSPDPDDLSVIRLESIEKAIQEKRIDFLALGDRHSVFSGGSTGRVWYAGSPEPTDFKEEDPGHALVVEISEGACRVEKPSTATWGFIERDQVDVNTKEDIDLLREWLEGLVNKERTVVKLRFFGTVTLSLFARQEEVLAHAGDLLAALELRDKNLVVIPDDEDFSELKITGFATKAVEKLRRAADSQDHEGQKARDALALLLRLYRETS